MIKIIELCLSQYNYEYIDGIPFDDLQFYKKGDKSIASYFLIYSIDCTDFEKDLDKMKISLEHLETLYSTKNDSTDSIKTIIQNQFEAQEASQIDKNTSAIYLLKFSDIKSFDNHRNSVYAIEESPNYFKRYILPYTQQQVDDLNNVMSSSNKPLCETLSDIAYDEDEYFKLMNRANVGSGYELAIRLFSKLPFLQYNFNASIAPQPIEEDINQKVFEKSLTALHDAVKTNESVLENWLSTILDDEIKEEEIDHELEKLIGGSV